MALLAGSAPPRIPGWKLILDLLSDGKPHTHHEVYAACPGPAHSRMHDLRRRLKKEGRTVLRWVEHGTHVYQLGSLDAGEVVASQSYGATSLASSERDSGAVDRLAGAPCHVRSDGPDSVRSLPSAPTSPPDPCVGAEPPIPGQLTLLDVA